MRPFLCSVCATQTVSATLRQMYEIYVTTIVFITRLLSSRGRRPPRINCTGASFATTTFNPRAAYDPSSFQMILLNRDFEPVAHCRFVLESSHSANPERVFFESVKPRTSRLMFARGFKEGVRADG